LVRNTNDEAHYYVILYVPSYFFLFIKTKYYPQHFVLKHSRSMFSPLRKRLEPHKNLLLLTALDVNK
jgi:hypothetical protein